MSASARLHPSPSRPALRRVSAGAALRRVSAGAPAARQNACTVRAGPSGNRPDLASDLRARGRSFMARHDVLSASVGALAVTTFCVLRGQEPAAALSITAAATVAALVAEEVLFSGGSSGRPEQ